MDAELSWTTNVLRDRFFANDSRDYRFEVLRELFEADPECRVLAQLIVEWGGLQNPERGWPSVQIVHDALEMFGLFLPWHVRESAVAMMAEVHRAGLATNLLKGLAPELLQVILSYLSFPEEALLASTGRHLQTQVTAGEAAIGAPKYHAYAEAHRRETEDAVLQAVHKELNEVTRARRRLIGVVKNLLVEINVDGYVRNDWLRSPAESRASYARSMLQDAAFRIRMSSHRDQTRFRVEGMTLGEVRQRLISLMRELIRELSTFDAGEFLAADHAHGNAWPSGAIHFWVNDVVAYGLSGIGHCADALDLTARAQARISAARRHMAESAEELQAALQQLQEAYESTWATIELSWTGGPASSS